MNYIANFRRVGYSTKEGINIWYVLPCPEQEEQKTLDICKSKLPNKALKKCFILTYDRMRRYEGVWHTERKILFPACVFLESEDKSSLAVELRKYSVLKANKLSMLDRETEIFLKRICGENGNLSMSKGIIHKGITHITKGPLKGLEGRICKIDRHKRLATVAAAALPETGALRQITAGLEITEKIV